VRRDVRELMQLGSVVPPRIDQAMGCHNAVELQAAQHAAPAAGPGIPKHIACVRHAVEVTAHNENSGLT
jgi:hypothetical protein